MWVRLAWIIDLIHKEEIRTNPSSHLKVRYHSLWLGTHKSSESHAFFWRTLLFSSVDVCSEIFKPGFWTNQSFNTDLFCCTRSATWPLYLIYCVFPCSSTFVKVETKEYRTSAKFSFQLFINYLPLNTFNNLMIILNYILLI